MVGNLKAKFPHDKFLEAGACLSHSSWPNDENQRALFGDQQVVNLTKLCPQKRGGESCILGQIFQLPGMKPGVTDF